jgi:acetyl-CoA C-acetyltransferase
VKPDPRSPCIIGVAAETWRDGPGASPEPLDMWAAVAGAAFRDSLASGGLGAVDAVHLVHCMSWSYDDPVARLSSQMGIEPSHSEVSVLAGTAGQRMVNAAGERMLRGESELALVVGGEALASRKIVRRQGNQPAWSYPADTNGAPPIDLDKWISPTEWVHGILQPTLTFALLDTARRHRLGVAVEEYRMNAAELLSRCSAVAATTPTAWFRTPRSATEIGTPTNENRFISSPYTKYMAAIMDVDMAAALLVATHAKADALGVPLDRRVYLRGWSFGRDAVHIAERPYLDRSPAMVRAAHDALRTADIGVDDVAQFDLYSCFAASVLFACDALELSLGDSRPPTVIGGLPYHGGPSSNYTTHAIVGMVDRLRAEGGFGVVSGVGMHMTKHVWAVYCSTPGRVAPPDYGEVQRSIDIDALRCVTPVVPEPTKCRIAAMSVTHSRVGAPDMAIGILDLPDGSRAYGRAFDPDTVNVLNVGEWVGQRVTIESLPDHSNAIRLPD